MKPAIHHATLLGSRHRVIFSRWRTANATKPGAYAEITASCGLAGSTDQWIDQSGRGRIDRAAPFCSECWDKADPPAGIVGAADFSPDGKHRLRLSRTWNAALGRVVFVGLNPSRANATVPDMTVSKLIGFADRWSYGEIVVVNLYTFVATQPAQLWAQPPAARRDPDWGAVLDEALKAPGRLVLGWGILPRPAQADAAELVARLQDRGVELWSLGRNADGSPPHPSRLPYETRPERWSPP